MGALDMKALDSRIAELGRVPAPWGVAVGDVVIASFGKARYDKARRERDALCEIRDALRSNAEASRALVDASLRMQRAETGSASDAKGTDAFEQAPAGASRPSTGPRRSGPSFEAAWDALGRRPGLRCRDRAHAMTQLGDAQRAIQGGLSSFRNHRPRPGVDKLSAELWSVQRSLAAALSMPPVEVFRDVRGAYSEISVRIGCAARAAGRITWELEQTAAQGSSRGRTGDFDKATAAWMRDLAELRAALSAAAVTSNHRF